MAGEKEVELRTQTRNEEVGTEDQAEREGE